MKALPECWRATWNSLMALSVGRVIIPPAAHSAAEAAMVRPASRRTDRRGRWLGQQRDPILRRERQLPSGASPCTLTRPRRGLELLLLGSAVRRPTRRRA